VTTPSITDRIAAIRATADARDGQIKVVLDGQADIVELSFDPRVMRMDADELAAAVRDTINEAREAARSELGQVVAEAAVGVPDRDKVAAELTQLEVGAEQRLSEMTATLNDLLKRLG
jgi:DNA-binding protein YbaB